MNKLILLLVFQIQTISITAQINKFDSLQNGLTFNMYTGAPDSIIAPFLINHFPYLTKKVESGGWSLYPPDSQETPQKGFHSLTIDLHPFIKQKHIGAQLDVFTQEWRIGLPGIERTRVWIYFADKYSAKLVYDSLITEFRNTGALIEVSSKGKQEKVKIVNNTPDRNFESISLILKYQPELNIYSLLILFFVYDGSFI